MDEKEKEKIKEMSDLMLVDANHTNKDGNDNGILYFILFYFCFCFCFCLY